MRVKASYLESDITSSGEKELLGLLVTQTERAKFWSPVVIELKKNGASRASSEILSAKSDIKLKSLLEGEQ